MYSYKNAGVDVSRSDLLSLTIKKKMNSDNFENFAGIIEHPYIPEYYLASSMDGVGSKIIPLLERNLIDYAVQDLVAMNLNDLACVGAKPIFFLDYIATSKLNLYVAAHFVESLVDELAKYNCTLIGGETDEIPSLITDGGFDVAGVAVGIVRKDKLLMKDNVSVGDLIIGLTAKSPHSNGYALIRQLYSEGKISHSEFGNMLLPTDVYINEISQLCDNELIKICAHITGGGIAGNLSRVIPEGCCASLNKANIPENQLFSKLEELVGTNEAYSVFNMGVGLCVICEPQKKLAVETVLAKFNPFILGEITTCDDSQPVKFV